MTHYVIRVKGTLSRELTNAFPSLAVHSEPAQTVLHGYLHDQAALAGVFNHLDMLGVDILEVMHVPQPARPQPARPEPARPQAARPQPALPQPARPDPDG
ncbi:hypothetical protein ACFPJ1_09080 [Kribbella qitaiheensis]|uniref:hypothetical protein n=1 Tax=Kribbella qitaiheensis TaxID=1544730 RepID=UPI0036200892